MWRWAALNSSPEREFDALAISNIKFSWRVNDTTRCGFGIILN
jgi:hypothetical protein